MSLWTHQYLFQASEDAWLAGDGASSSGQALVGIEAVSQRASLVQSIASRVERSEGLRGITCKQITSPEPSALRDFICNSLGF